MNDNQKMQRLINRGNSYLGMIREAESKCLLLKNKILKESECCESTEQSYLIRFRQIQYDLDRYTRKLNRVHQELISYDLSQLE